MSGCKVDRLIEKYDLEPPEPRYDDIDERLLARWTGADGGSADGYRPLTEWFNRRVLRSIYAEHGRETIGTRLENEYETLTDGEELARQELIDDLAADGIDIEQFYDDTISWSTMRHHLKDCLDGTKERETSTTDWERESIRIAREHATKKVQEAVSSLASKDELPGGKKADVQVDVQVSCPECPTRVPLQDAVSRGYICKDHLNPDE